MVDNNTNFKQQVPNTPMEDDLDDGQKTPKAGFAAPSLFVLLRFLLNYYSLKINNFSENKKINKNIFKNLKK